MNRDLSQHEVTTRKPIWQALSGFWLDTELQDLEFNYIARVIAESPYSIDEVRAIHRNEVAPAVAANLASMAGEWTGFDEAWLEARCHENARKRRSPFRRARLWLQAPVLWFFTARYWRQVIPRVHALRKGIAPPIRAQDPLP
jgi:hypothetical protein